jgi:hypothetical protein
MRALSLEPEYTVESSGLRATQVTGSYIMQVLYLPHQTHECLTLWPLKLIDEV